MIVKYLIEIIIFYTIILAKYFIKFFKKFIRFLKIIYFSNKLNIV
jgi:hypothetical protein